MFASGENAYIKDWNAGRIVMIFLCFYLDEGRANACICMGTHTQPLLYIARLILMKLGLNEVLKVPYMF